MTTVLLAGWGVETRSWALHAATDEDLVLIGPEPPADPVGGVVHVGDEVPPDLRPDRILRSPGFRPHDPRIAALVAEGVPTTTPTGDWFVRRPDPGRIVAITGSKAKSSTSSLVGVGLDLLGVEARVVGNIGTSVWDPIGRTTSGDGVTIVELSSYQCHDLPAGADLAAITFLAIDHVDWHGTLGEYHAAKLRLVELTAPRPCLTGSPGVVEASRQAGLEMTLVPTASSDPRRQNVALAAAVVRELVDADADAATTSDLADRMYENYPVLPGRFATIGWVGGCEVIDDALGSNPTATSAALRAVGGRRVAWIMGGASRGVDLSPLVDGARLLLADGGHIFTFGDSGAILRGLLAPLTREVHEVTSLEDAVSAGLAVEPDVLLFSPSGPTPKAEGTWRERSARLRASAERAGMTGSPT